MDAPSSSPARTLAQVAAAAGVSKMTVSRVLRHPELVSEATRKRVLACIGTLSYRPNPLISTLMSATRQRRASATDAGIAYLVSEPQEAIHSYEVAERILHGAKERATRKGYELIPHSLADERLPVTQLPKIFKARGIEGIIFGPLKPKHAHLPIDLERLAGVACGYTLLAPAVHRVATNQRELAAQAYLSAKARGYQRIGLAFHEGAPLGRHWLSAIHEVHDPHASTLPVLTHTPLPQGRAAFACWLEQEQPDCVIASTPQHHQWLSELGLRAPDDIGFLLLGHDRAHGELAGFSKNYEGIGATAVDLIALQLHDNERGLPTYRKTILLDPKWNEGCTLHPALSAPSP